MKIVKLDRTEWAAYAEKAHLIAFNKNRPFSWDRTDYALMCVDEGRGIPLGYLTVMEHDAESVYWQFGGTFPGTKGTVTSWSCFIVALQWARTQAYKRIFMRIENTNRPMLKMALRAGFLIVGSRAFEGTVLVEHVLDFERR